MTFPIIQFGASCFLQAHVDLFVSEALKQGEAMGRIVAIQTTQSPDSKKRIAAFATGKPYVVKIKGVAQSVVVDEEVEVASVGGGVDANEQWEEVQRVFNEARSMVSNTGDRGYETNAADWPKPTIFASTSRACERRSLRRRTLSRPLLDERPSDEARSRRPRSRATEGRIGSRLSRKA